MPEARTILAFSTRAAARDVEKVLRSAVANAETNPNLQWNGDELYVTAAYVDEGPTIKRWRARARGRVNRILKRTCHITIKLDQLEAVRVRRQRQARGSRAAPARAARQGGAAAAKPKTRKKKEAAA